MQDNQKLVIFGAGGHAKSVLDAALACGRDVIYCVDEACAGETLLSVPIKASAENSEHISYVIAVGDNHRRARIRAELVKEAPNLVLATIIHPTAYVSAYANIGQGSVVLAQANVNAGCEVGAGCIINSHASLDHDVIAGDFTSFAPGAIIGGGVSVGRSCAVNMGAKVKHGVSIGDECVIGANSYVHKDCDAGYVYYGSPAKKIRSRASGEAYL